MDRPLALVQSIVTRWSKASRSPTKSARRNAIPEVLDLPEDGMHGPAVAVGWHDVRVTEPDFIPSASARLVTLSLVRVPQLDLVHSDDGCLRVDLLGKPCFRLARRESGTLVYTFADSETVDNWRVDLFQKVSVHVAFDVAPERHLFRRRPTHTMRLIRDLP